MIDTSVANPDHQYQPNELAIINEFRNNALPFLADECIVNATYLLFNAGKRDFDNVLCQVSNVFAAETKVTALNTNVAAMKLGIALADTDAVK